MGSWSGWARGKGLTLLTSERSKIGDQVLVGGDGRGASLGECSPEYCCWLKISLNDERSEMRERNQARPSSFDEAGAALPPPQISIRFRRGLPRLSLKLVRWQPASNLEVERLSQAQPPSSLLHNSTASQLPHLAVSSLAKHTSPPPRCPRTHLPLLSWTIAGEPTRPR